MIGWVFIMIIDVGFIVISFIGVDNFLLGW